MSGATLKRIAVITMLVDHIGAAFFYIFTSGYDGSAAFAGADAMYQVLRIIGRTSFPIFCFLLVEGFLHTRSVVKYLCRLLVFAIVSEVPFDLAFFDKAWDTAMQNVYFTLFFGVLAMTVLRWGGEAYAARKKHAKWLVAAGVLGAAACLGAAYLLRTDYAWKGVLLILVLYVLRRQRRLSCLAGYVTMCIAMTDSWGFPAFFLIDGYNGEKGNGSKYFFYVFYPVHLLVLAGIRFLYLKYM